jgi:hypothetical protein
MKEFTKNKISLFLEDTYKWIKLTDEASSELETPPGMPEWAKKLMSAMTKIAAVLVPAGVFTYEFLKSIADGLAYPNAVTHTLAVLGEKLLLLIPWLVMKPMLAGGLALAILVAAVLVTGTGLKYLLNWIVQRFQKRVNKIGVSLFLKQLELLKEKTAGLMRDIDNVTTFKLLMLKGNIESVAEALYVDIDDLNPEDVEATPNTDYDRFLNEENLSFMLAKTIIPKIYDLCNDPDIPLSVPADFADMTQDRFLSVLEYVGVVDPDGKYPETLNIEDFQTIFDKEVLAQRDS